MRDKEETRYLLHPQHHSRNRYGLSPEHEGQDTHEDDSDDDSDEDDEQAKANLLSRADNFSLSYDAQRGYRGTEMKITSFQRPHMRAFHGSWICFFASFFTMFSISPLLPIIQKSLKLSQRELWQGNLAMMIGKGSRKEYSLSELLFLHFWLLLDIFRWHPDACLDGSNG